MTLLVHYPTKKALRESVGKPLRYSETSIFGAEYRPDGVLIVAGRPHLDQRIKREYFAEVHMRNGLIEKVK